MEFNVINKSDSRYTRMIQERIGHEVLLQINHNHYNFWEKKNAFFFFVKELLKPIILN